MLSVTPMICLHFSHVQSYVIFYLILAEKVVLRNHALIGCVIAICSEARISILDFIL